MGTSTIRRVLQDAGSSYQRTRTWCPTGTAQRKRKAGVVTVIDPHTEKKRGSSTWPTASLKASVFPCGARMRPGRTRRSRSRASPGEPVGKPRRQPHEYIRGGTAKLLTLFRPATGEVRAKGGDGDAPNTVLHPWLQHEAARRSWLTYQTRHADSTSAAPPAHWATWLGHVPHLTATTTAADPRLGQSGRPFEHVDRHLVVRARGDAAVHPAERLLAEHGRVRPTHPLRPGAERAASAERGGTHHLAGGHGRWLECRLQRPSSGTANAANAASAPNNVASAAPLPSSNHQLIAA